jgi:hypothetical protein
MDLNSITESLGEKPTIALTGLLIGLLFGIFAQRSRFCLRAAVVEFWNRAGTSKLAIWLFAFSTAIITTQLLITQGWLDVSQARQLSATGSLSGARPRLLIPNAGAGSQRQPARAAHRTDFCSHCTSLAEWPALAAANCDFQSMDNRRRFSA